MKKHTHTVTRVILVTVVTLAPPLTWAGPPLPSLPLPRLINHSHHPPLLLPPPPYCLRVNEIFVEVTLQWPAVKAGGVAPLTARHAPSDFAGDAEELIAGPFVSGRLLCDGP